MSDIRPVQSEEDAAITEAWRKFLTLGVPPGYENKQVSLTTFRRLMKLLPMDPRCMICNAPFHGAGGFAVKVALGRGPSGHSPKVCNRCDQFAQKFQGGAEVELSMLFADVRGSTGMAETLGALEFSRLINRFFKATSAVLVESNAMIDKLVGDEVIGLFVPGLAGSDHAPVAIKAAQEMLRVTGHSDPKVPWISLGVGVHAGVAFVGAVGSAEGAVQVTALGDAVQYDGAAGFRGRPGRSAGQRFGVDGRGPPCGGCRDPVPSIKGPEPTRRRPHFGG